MLETTITKMFNIRYPIIQGGLQGLGTSSLVAAVSNAGGLGLITAGSYSSKEEMLRDIEATRRLTLEPFGVNITIGVRKPMDEFVEGVIEAEIPVVFTSGNNPEKYIDLFKRHNIKVVHVVPSIRFAKKAEKLGCDAVVVVGFECGGHPGKDEVTSLILVQKAVQQLSIPVIAAGGFSTGKSMLAAFALGAQAIQMGTRFLATKEVQLHSLLKSRLLQLQETDTIIVKKSIGKPARVMKTDVAIKLAKLEENGASFEEIFPFISGEAYQELISTSNDNRGVLALGQTVGLVNEIKSVQEVIQEVITEYEIQLQSLANHFKNTTCSDRV
ncbi:NAD(P)H-dependent flavin oxidoreductase [Calidifontibacillus oryziterrae]|uniref:NAD(P)H-dependent flavin oxidoreductase n=1 Tax=Calidifontibacillus oryziterrae TaxID=1191699 RepID=UPI000302A7CF|nr:nitronate monooxygenase [Calidifontibacillus oryziterrae]